MKRSIIFFIIFFFVITAQAADNKSITTRKEIKTQIRVVAPVDIKFLGSMIARGEPNEAVLVKWRAMLAGTNYNNIDITSLVQWVLQESYQEQAEDLKEYADKVQYFNEAKKKIRDELDKVRKTKIIPDAAPLYKLNITTAKGPPPRILMMKAGLVKTDQERQDYVRYLESKVAQVDADGQLANVDMQNVLQKQQQIIQQISNLSKLLFDTAMDVSRKQG